MEFYFICYFILGLCLGSYVLLLKQREVNFLSVPKWVSVPGYIDLVGLFAVGAPILGVITSLFNAGFFWGMVSAGEILLGVFVAGFLRMEMRAMVAAFSPLAQITILGALWGWWYI